jgi:hypothetical protein
MSGFFYGMNVLYRTYEEVLEAALSRFGGIVDPLAGLDEGEETDKTEIRVESNVKLS